MLTTMTNDLEIEVLGTATFGPTIRLLKNCQQQYRTFYWNSILVDLRAATLSLNILELDDLPALIQGLFDLSETKVALLVNPRQERINRISHFHSSAYIRGIRCYKLFESIVSAREWLESKYPTQVSLNMTSPIAKTNLNFGVASL